MNITLTVGLVQTRPDLRGRIYDQKLENLIHWFICARVLTPMFFSIQEGMVLKPIVGVYILIVRISTKGGMTIPNIGSLDLGTYKTLLYP